MSGAANPQTIPTLREIHEGCKARHFQDPDWKIKTGGSVCARCSRIWPCDDHKDAVAALDLTAEMETRLRAMIDANPCWFSSHDRITPARDCRKVDGAYCDQCAVRWDCESLLASLVPDLAPSEALNE